MPASDPRLYRLGAGLLLAGLWAGGAMAFPDAAPWPARAALAAAALPLIALLLDDGRRLPPGSQHVIALSAPITLLWALYHPALASWWIRDDPCHLVKILELGLWRPFVSSIGHFLTPWLNLSLGSDFALFGLEPLAFYLHQLLSSSVLIAAGYVFLRPYLTPAASSLALALFVTSVPTFAVVRLLMNRHYLEGLVLALASLTLYRRSVAHRRLPLAIVGAALYLLATTAKEVFVPLILLLPMLGGDDRRRRWRHAMPFIFAAGVYGLWRLSMLGWSNSLSGYGALGGEFRLEALARVPALLGLDRPWQLGLAVAAVAAIALALRRRIPRAGLALAAGLVALGAPLMPVAARLEPRHFFLPAFAAATLLAAALEAPLLRRFPPLRAMIAIVLLLWALASLTGSHFWHRFEPDAAHHQSEGSFVLDGSRGGLLMTTVNHSTFLECLARLRREVLEQSGGPGFCGDGCYCAERFPGERRWRYADGQVSPDTTEANDSCDARQPLAIELSHDESSKRMSWSFGPYPEGAYEILLISGAEVPGVSIPVAVPRQGSMPYWLSEPLRFVVKYRSPEGWQTYSAVHSVEPDGDATAEP